MKTNRFFTNTLAALAVAGVLLASVNLSHADDATNAVTSHATNRSTFSIDFDTGHKNTGAENYYGLPKEAFDRLSPEQIMELAQSRQTLQTQMPDIITTIVIPVSMFTMIAVCVWLGVSQRLKRNHLLHDTIRLMIEKGQPIPPELLQPTDPQRRPRNDLRTGLILIGVGIGIWFMPLGEVVVRSGLIPLLIGVAFLTVWVIETRKNGPSK